VRASAAELKKRTLTNLYNERPTWLETCSRTVIRGCTHKRMAETVLEAYGWTGEIGEEEILERLLKLNGERAKAR
jgi:hypothetical protein